MFGSLAPIRIGLTGSIGMGKSTITKQFRKLGFPVFDADESVHQLYSENGGAVKPIREILPSVIINNAVNRGELMKLILANPEILPEIERIVHPLVVADRQEFTAQCMKNQQLIVVYDIPLLFEKFQEYKDEIDYVIVVSCDAKTQAERVLSRPNMNKEKFDSILAKQVPDEYKRQNADYVIYTNYSGYVEGRSQLARVIEDILVQKEPLKFDMWKGRAYNNKNKSTADPPSTARRSSLMVGSNIERLFDAVFFDLDDTLSPTLPTLENGIKGLVSAMERLMPKTYERYVGLLSVDSVRAFNEVLRREMAIVRKENPLVQHDLTETRKLGLVRLARETGEEEQVDECVQAFIQERSNIGPYLYSDTVSCLQFFKSLNIRLGILSNGNCDLKCVGYQGRKEQDINQYLDCMLSASQVGCSKPSIVGFLSCAQLIGNIPISRILYVGDDYEKDVVGAAAAGMKTAYLVRDPLAYQSILSDPSHRFHPDQFQFNKINYLLNNLQPSHLQEEIQKRNLNHE